MELIIYLWDQCSTLSLGDETAEVLLSEVAQRISEGTSAQETAAHESGDDKGPDLILGGRALVFCAGTPMPLIS